jgi:hypothetical protein
MKLAPKLVAVVVAIVLAACRPSSDPELLRSLPAIAPQAIWVLDVCDLLREPARYDGRTLSVRGVFIRGVEGPELGDANCPNEPVLDSPTRNTVCLSLRNMQTSAADESTLRTTRWPEVVMRGTFHRIRPCPFNENQAGLVVHSLEDVRPASLAAWPRE